MMKTFTLALALLLASTFTPSMALADSPTGNEPWSAASLEANPPGTNGYVLKNLTNSHWQDSLNIWWRATVPCGTFSGSGLSATWDHTGCGTIDYAKTPVYIAVIIENTKVSGAEYLYPDHLGTPAKYPPEHLIVYAEYPEEGFEHGFGTSLMYYGYDTYLKYDSAKEGTANTNPLPNLWGVGGKVPVVKTSAEPALMSTQSEKSTSEENRLPLMPIAAGALVLAGAGYLIRGRMIGGDYGPEHTKKPEAKQKKAASCAREYESMQSSARSLKEANDHLVLLKQEWERESQAMQEGYVANGADIMVARRAAITKAEREQQAAEKTHHEATASFKKCASQGDHELSPKEADELKRLTSKVDGTGK